MLSISPILLKAICISKNLSYAELYKRLGLNEHFTESYFYKVIKGSKPVTEGFKILLDSKINEALTTEELIKVIKLQEYLK